MIKFMGIFVAVLSLSLPRTRAENQPDINLNAPVTTELSPNAAIGLAKQAAAKKGIDPDKYTKRDITLRLSGKQWQWCLLFEPPIEKASFGDHFFVFINDETKTVEFRPGS